MAKPGLESRLPACNRALLPPSVCRSPLLPTPLHPPTQVTSVRRREEGGPGRILFYSGRVICFRQWQVPAGPFPKSPLPLFPMSRQSLECREVRGLKGLDFFLPLPSCFYLFIPENSIKPIDVRDFSLTGTSPLSPPEGRPLHILLFFHEP